MNIHFQRFQSTNCFNTFAIQPSTSLQHLARYVDINWLISLFLKILTKTLQRKNSVCMPTGTHAETKTVFFCTFKKMHFENSQKISRNEVQFLFNNIYLCFENIVLFLPFD